MNILHKKNIRPILIITFLLIPSLIVGILGIDRVYYALPDQDLLWINESFRIFKGLGPSYADHPGGYWPISFFLKISLFSFFNSFEILDQNGIASIEVIQNLIFWGRIEASIISGLVGIIFYFILKEIKIKESIAIISSYTLCFSSAILNSVSAIRHEAIGMLFLLIYLLYICKNINKETSSEKSLIRCVFLQIIFTASIFSKIQILLLYPLILLSFFIILKNKEYKYFQNLMGMFSLKKMSTKFGIFILSGLPWILTSLKEIYEFGLLYLVNLPFWSLINSGTIISMMIVSNKKINKILYLKSLLNLLIFQLIFYYLLFPDLWRRTVGAFPAMMTFFTDLSQDRFTSFFEIINKYSSDLIWSKSLGLLFIICFFIILIFEIIFALKNKIKIPMRVFALLSILYLTFVLSFRSNQLYQIYFLIPIIFIISTTLNNRFFRKTFLIERIYKIMAIIFLIFCSIKSTSNIFLLKNFISYDTNNSICINQHVDYNLRNTPVGECKNFDLESFKKEKYN